MVMSASWAIIAAPPTTGPSTSAMTGTTPLSFARRVKTEA